MTRRRITIIAVAALALGLAFAAGRWTARPPTVHVEEQGRQETSETTTETREVVEAASSSTTTDRAEAEVRVVYRDRWYREDGSLEHEREVEAEASAAELREEAQADVRREEQGARVEVRTEVVEVERLVHVEAEAPRWLVGAVGGIGSDGEARYGAQVHYRLLGPVHVSAGALLGGGEAVGIVGVGVAW